MPPMEKLVADIEAFAAEFGMTPQKFLRDAINSEWGRWQKWKAGEASPTMLIVDRIYDFMATYRAEHTPTSQEDAA